MDKPEDKFKSSFTAVSPTKDKLFSQTQLPDDSDAFSAEDDLVEKK